MAPGNIRLPVTPTGNKELPKNTELDRVIKDIETYEKALKNDPDQKRKDWYKEQLRILEEKRIILMNK